MPRPRKKENAQLPEYVYLWNARYVYRPYLGKGKLGRPIRLAPATATLTEVWDAHSQVLKAQNAQRPDVRWLLEQYLKSDRFKSKAPRTQKDYLSYFVYICAQPLKGGGKFEAVVADAVTTVVVRKFADVVAKERGKRTANHFLSLLRSAYAWGVEYGKVQSNPCVGVKNFSVKARTRYVEDDEYRRVRRAAPASVKVAMELAYLCRLRIQEVLALKKSDCLDPGLRAKRLKGSKTQVIGWTRRLRRVIRLADTLPGHSSEYIVHNRAGEQYTVDGFESIWQRQVRKLEDRFTFHDIKAKGVSDFEGDRHKASGHQTYSMTAVYDRKLDVVIATR